MIIGYKFLAASAAAAMLGGAGGAQAQGYYASGDLPPPPYAYVGVGYGGGCRSDRFTLVGAHAGVTVLGVDLSGAAALSVPVDEYCGGGVPVFEPRPYAPPPQPMAYGPCCQQTYAPPPPPPPPMNYGYSYPCGCQAPPRW